MALGGELGTASWIAPKPKGMWQRTYARHCEQMEALSKHRSGGKQTDTMLHAKVENGGQAILGDIRHGTRAKDEN